ncbi:SRPBCC domain-containing protein [Streptomyces sp. NPDC048290]|uniref:SRPBCC family protein n=1 Tax=Streptomyces sp. NPDC048290 TaxID=3155811 RepID=UPI003422E7D6
MTVKSFDKDLENLTLTLTAEFPAPVDKVWQLWADPRRLERWWGPPSYPTTFVEYDLTPGGDARYFMTGPEGDKHHGYWRISTVEPPAGLEFTEGFTHADGTPDDAMPSMNVRVRLVAREGGTRMEMRSQFDSRAQMEQMFAMGVEEGLTTAVGQMDALLTEL